MSWEMVPFESVYSEPSRNGVYKPAEHHGSGAKIVNMGELFAHEFIGAQEMSRLRMSDAELEKAGLIEGDLLFGRRSLVESGAGKCSVVEGVTEPLTFESSIIRVRTDMNLVVPRFLYYWFKSRLGRGSIRAIVSGTNVKGIRGSDLKKVLVPRPKTQVQEAIACELSAYDNLIENNRRRIALLEQSARLLYREWFAHLRFPGHEHVKVVDGVPEGWSRSPIRSRFKTVLGGTPSRKRAEYWEGGTIPWINSGMVNEIRIVVPSELITPLALAESAAKLMPAKTTVLAITGATLGQVSMLEIECAANQSVVGVTDESDLLSEYIYLCLKDRAKELIALGTGGAQIHINKEVVNAFEVLLPDDALAREFTDFVKPTFSQVTCLAMTNFRLEMARDLLLPRLMSGDLVV